jgi:hypothetical protein
MWGPILAVRDARRQEAEFRSYVQEAAGSQSPADQLAKLVDLRDRGVITAAEFEREKARSWPERECHLGPQRDSAQRVAG